MRNPISLKPVVSLLMLLACIAICAPLRAEEPQFAYFDYSKLEFRTSTVKMQRFEIPPAPVRLYRADESDVETFLNGMTNSTEWMESYGRLAYMEEPLPAAPAKMDRRASLRWNNLIELRKATRRTKPSTPQEKIIQSYRVGSRIEDKDALGGFNPSGNYPQAIPPKLLPTGSGIRLIARLDDLTMYDAETRGYSLYVVNGGGQVETFDAADGTLDIWCEALAPDGTWTRIDVRPNYFCGSSYHRVFLEPNQCWRIPVPEFEGEQETRVRYRLPRPPNGGDVLSNEVVTRVPIELFAGKAAQLDSLVGSDGN